jgi:hypothetical protein
MATRIIPKSEARENINLQIGYGELPGILKGGTIFYALPSGQMTDDKTYATSVAKRIDTLVRRNMAQETKHTIH